MSAVPDLLRTAFAPEAWPVFVLISARLGGLMLTAPLWSMTTMPHGIRAALTVVVAMVLLPAAPRVPMPAEVLDLPLPLMVEMAVGMAIGLVAGVLVHAAGLAGEVLSLQMGLSLGPHLSPVPELQVAGVAPLTTLVAVFVYLAVGGHLAMLEGLADSLHALPPGRGLDLAAGGAAARAAGALFSCALTTAAPVLVTLLLANVALAILSRAVPQLNAMLVSFPITIALGLLMLAASLPIVTQTTARWMHALPDAIERTLGHWTARG